MRVRLFATLCIVLSTASAVVAIPPAPDASPFVKLTTLLASNDAHDVLKQPSGVAVDSSTGVVYVVDTMHHRVVAVDPDGKVAGTFGNGKPGLENGSGSSVRFKEPRSAAFDSARGLLYVADTGNHVVRRVTRAGVVTTVAGSGRPGLKDGTGTDASFRFPAGIAVDAEGNVYVADTGNSRIRKVSSSGVVTSLTGGLVDGLADGPAARALFNKPEGVAVAVDGRVYVADTGNHLLRLYEHGAVSTIAGTGHGGFLDGPVRLAEFKSPSSVAVGDSGDLYVADRMNHAIRRVTTGDDPRVSTISGTGKNGYLDGAPAEGQFHEPAGVAVAGALYVADAKNDALRIIYPRLSVAAVTPAFGDPSGGARVRITGGGFVPGATRVRFDSASGVDVTYRSATEIDVTAPAHPIGLADVTVRTAAGTATLPEAFEYRPPYVALQLTPPTLVLAPGDAAQVSAAARAADGASTDVTSAAAWSSRDTAVATVDSSGRITAVAEGATVIDAAFAGLSASVAVEVALPQDDPVPPDPSTVAPPLDPTVTASLHEELAFLYSGSNAIQTGVAPGTITEEKATLLRGRVANQAGRPLLAVRVSIAGHPELGSTLSRADGWFDLVINGGGTKHVRFEREGYVTVDRAVATIWNEQRVMEDVVLTRYDAAVTKLTMNAPATQVVRGSQVSDADGARRATLVIPAGTTAELQFTDGSTQPAGVLHVRATELTVGPSGPKAMPAPLPPSSAYTYCVELSADEAVAAGAASVRFSKPLAVYVENFIGFPVGGAVPSGYYDRAANAWMSSENGRVVRIVSLTSGGATLDVTGDGVADTSAVLAALGVTDAERELLATLYPAGQSLWRVPVTHFTPWDYNWPYAPPDDARLPNLPQPDVTPMPEKGCTVSGWSTVDCVRGSLGESVAIAGTPFRLEYNSARAPVSRYSTTIPLSGDSLPESLQRIDLTVTIAGVELRRTFPAAPNQKYVFTWDGKDAYGRTVEGARLADIVVGYVYRLRYLARGPEQTRAWAVPGARGTPVDAARLEVTFAERSTAMLGTIRGGLSAFGGWMLDAQRFYDGRGRIIYEGAGQRSADPDRTGELGIATSAGTGQGFEDGQEGVPATTAAVFPESIGVAPDGTIYLAEGWAVRKISPDGIISTIAGSRQHGYTPDDFPALGNPIDLLDLAVAPDGTLYLNQSFDRRIRTLVNGLYKTVAGNGQQTTALPVVQGVPATSIAIIPEGIAVGPDGTLYIAEGGRVLRVGPDGLAYTLIGGGGQRFERPVEGGIALDYWLAPSYIAAGPDGSVYVDDRDVIWRISPDGRIFRAAGAYFDEASDFVRDGQPATSGLLSNPAGMTVAADGTLLIAESSGNRVRAVDPNGIITTVAGNGAFGTRNVAPDFTLARGTTMKPIDVDIAPDGSPLIVDDAGFRIRRAAATFPALRGGAAVIASADGTEAYVFEQGRHVRTVDTLTGATTQTLRYDSRNLLVGISDADGNVTTIERNAAGDAEAIVAPGGQRTTLMVSGGRLTSIANPPGESYHFTYDSNGLLRELVDPRRGVHTFTYDEDGLLLRDTDPAGGFIDLARTRSGGVTDAVRTSAEGRTQSYRVQVGSDFIDRRLYTGLDGRTTSMELAAGKERVTSPEGMTVTATTSGDPRFGVQVPVVRSLEILAPSGLRSVTTYQRDVQLASPGDPLSLRSLTEKTTVNGRLFTNTYDAATRTITTKTPLGRVTTARLDTRGRLALSTVPGLADTTYGYDERGRLRSVAMGSRSVSYEYNDANELVSVTDALQRTTSFTYDAAGRPALTTLPGNRVIGYSHDAHGNVASVAPPGRGTHSFEYTPVDLPQMYEPPPGGDPPLSYAYNRDRQLRAFTRADGTSFELVYDEAGRLTRFASRDEAYTYGYDAASGQLVTVGDAAGNQLSYTYDGTLVTAVSWAGRVSGSVTLVYDNNLRVQRENGVTYTYDSDGLVTNAGALRLTRSATNGLLSGTVLGTVTDTYTYNAFGEVQRYVAKAGAATIIEVDYVRDAAGRIEKRTEKVFGNTIVTAYTYDTAGRLGQVTTGTAATTYRYDTNGNRLLKEGAAGQIAGVYDDHDRLTSYGGVTFTYTPNGELATRADANGTTRYTYDSLGNLTGVVLPGGRTIEYIVDPQGRRIGRKVDGALVRGWLYADQQRIVAELDGNGAVISQFVYGSRTNAPDYMVRSGVTYRFLHDHLGSVRIVLNTGTGAVAQMLGYDEFGNVLSDTAPGFQPFGFAGGLYDGDTKLVRFGARDYDPYAGRWTSKDPIGYAGSDTNLYAYVLNDPINLVDPMGTDWVDALETVANFSAGFGDTMTFGATDWIRDQIGGNEGIDRCGGAYAAGMYTQITAEVALTGGSFALRGAAKGITQAAARRGMSSAIPRGVKGISELHHINPLKTGLFPTAPLPAAIRHHRANLKILSLADHRAAHRLLAQQERALAVAFNPATTAARVVVAGGGQCGCP